MQGGEERWRGNELEGVQGKKNIASKFLDNILREEEEIRKSLAVPKQIKMAPRDWTNSKQQAIVTYVKKD